MKFRRNELGYYSTQQDQGELKGIAPRVIEKQNKIKKICLECTEKDCNGSCPLVDKRIKGINGMKRGRKPKFKEE